VKLAIETFGKETFFFPVSFENEIGNTPKGEKTGRTIIAKGIQHIPLRQPSLPLLHPIIPVKEREREKTIGRTTD
jgi:hypothetical protein